MRDENRLVFLLIVFGLIVLLVGMLLHAFVTYKGPFLTVFPREEMLGHLLIDSGLLVAFGIAVAKILSQKQTKLGEDDKKYRLIAENLHEGIWVLDKEDYTTFVNDSMAKMLGYSGDEMLGKHFFSFMDRSGVEIARDSFGRCRQGLKEYLDFEFLGKDRNRVYARVAAAPIIDKFGNYDGAIIGIVDVTERKRLEEKLRQYSERLEDLVVERTRELRESEKKYRRLVENIPDIAWTIDWKGHIVFVSPRIVEMCGYTPEEITEAGSSFWYGRIHAEDLERVKEAYEALFTRNRMFDVEYRIQRKDGEWIWISDRAGAIYYRGDVLYGDGVFSDITEWKRMQETLLKTQHLAAVGQTAAMVGHDLRNPLQAMIGRLYLARKTLEGLSDTRSETAAKLGLDELFNELEEQTEYMNKIVSDLQDFARPLKPELVQVDLKKLINDTLSTIEVPEDVIVSIEAGDDIPSIVADPALMRRLLNNLITNAIQAMSQGGQLTVRTAKTEHALSVNIQDTGVGIPRESLDKIFSPFYTTKSKGMGLGLAVCKHIAEAHKGSITVESERNRGTTFTVKLPFSVKPA